ncbi:MAG: hypothetical protein J6T35_06570 [Bacteroidales bacterium]|nr:hypothetical protein [Bacteroidales bacterium]
MRKILYIVLLLIFVSCGSKDKNISIAKSEFKAYVQKTFDDPSSLKEIVEIAPHDTISLKSMRTIINMSIEGIEQRCELWKLKDSLNLEQLEAILKRGKAKRQPTFSEAIQGAMLLEECSSYADKISDAKKPLYLLKFQLQKLNTELAYHPAIYVYEIKYRHQLKDGLKLESAYVYIDSLSGFKAIMPEQDDTSIISEDYNNVFQKSKESLIATKKVEGLYEKQKENLDEIVKYTQKFQ